MISYVGTLLFPLMGEEMEALNGHLLTAPH